MKIALVRPPKLLGNSSPRGIGFYTERLLTAFKERKVDVSLIDFSFLPGAYKNFDVVHFPYFDFYFPTLPPFPGTKTVVTVHDIIPLLNTAAFPELTNKLFPAGFRASVVWPWQKTLLKAADHVLTDSDFSKSEITKYIGLKENKITTTYLAADSKFQPITEMSLLAKVREKYNLKEKFVLYVGGANWNKNVKSLVAACQSFEIPLVVVGGEYVSENVDWTNIENSPLKEIKAIATPTTRFLGFVPTDDLVAIYNLASVYVQPSIHEGFGFPVLEALSCGTAVICGKNSSLPEIGGGAVRYTSVTDVSNLSETIKEVFSKTNNLKTAGSLQAKKFSWGRTAEETYEVYKRVLQNR